MQDIWKLEKRCIWSGIVYSDRNGKNNMETFIGSKRSKSDYLGVFQTVCCLANFVYSLFNGKLPAMYNCVKCVCICVIVSWGGLIFMVSLDFKTLWKMFTQRGEYVTSVQK